MENAIIQKLIKQKHLFDTYAKKSENMPFSVMCHLLAERILTEVEEAGMLPPLNKKLKGLNPRPEYAYNVWESEDEEK